MGGKGSGRKKRGRERLIHITADRDPIVESEIYLTAVDTLERSYIRSSLIKNTKAKQQTARQLAILETHLEKLNELAAAGLLNSDESRSMTSLSKEIRSLHEMIGLSETKEPESDLL